MHRDVVRDRDPRNAVASENSYASRETVAEASIRRVEPRCRITSSSSGDGGGVRSSGPDFHGQSRVSRSPARCIAVISGNSSGALSIVPATASPPGSIAGAPSSSVTSATGHSCTPSAPTSAVTCASGNFVHSHGRIQPDRASSSSCASIVPLSQ